MNKRYRCLYAHRGERGYKCIVFIHGDKNVYVGKFCRLMIDEFFNFFSSSSTTTIESKSWASRPSDRPGPVMMMMIIIFHSKSKLITMTMEYAYFFFYFLENLKQKKDRTDLGPRSRFWISKWIHKLTRAVSLYNLSHTNNNNSSNTQLYILLFLFLSLNTSIYTLKF